MSAAPAFSIVTVCFNAAAVLPRAIASLAAQRGATFEWVVVDGGSGDGTQALVQAAPVRPAAFVSERDRGIYDAMNKGVALARGDIVYFLNADDALHDADVLADVAARFAARPALELLFGRVVVEKPGLEVLNSPRWINRATLPFADPCHQAAFARRGLFARLGGFDLRWPTSADYDWFLRARRAGVPMATCDRTVARFRAGGAHARDPQALAAERRALRRQYVSPPLLAAGSFAMRAAHRLSRTFRGGLAVGESRVAAS